ncbi:MAG: major capsid protein, partial [bacterium]|nr:major capsid protein [bacterium]
HDYFTSALPQPQKGEPVTLPLRKNAPVTGNFLIGTDANNNTANLYIGDGYTIKSFDLNANTGTSIRSVGGANGLQADLTQATAATINQLRQAFQIQKLLERDARGGTRYIEIIKSHFGITSPDARMQRAEYLGGKRVPITMAQVLQNSQSTEQSPLGNTAAYSLTTGSHSSFTKSFTEHGYIMGLACVRVEHSYQQGIEKMWSRKDRFDFYWPALANIGEQAILNKEIYAQGKNVAEDEQAFGYQEAWAEYRYKNNQITGYMRSGITGSLDIWHFGDKYNALPKLSQGWIEEGTQNIDQTLAATSNIAPQFIADFYFKVKATRPMPIYSIPGLIDHN